MSVINPILDKVWIGAETADQAVARLEVELKKHPLLMEEKH
jgi:hypothetical protein